MKKILVVFGTRPEAIKMAPVVHALAKYPEKAEIRVCITAQHREMLDQVLRFFAIAPHYDLNLMRPGQQLGQLTANVLSGMQPVLDDFRPDIVLVHGDTTTSVAAALAAFYARATVAHVEAGLRTQDKLSPYPEELNRQLTSRIADLHFAPTEQARLNLLQEHIPAGTVIVTGNTVVDALHMAIRALRTYRDSEINSLEQQIDPRRRLLLVTAHRRENFGKGFTQICEALRHLALHEEIQIVFPVHLNPQVQQPVYSLLKGLPNVHLVAPLGYPAFTWLMQRSYLVITDSGGVQEEAPGLGKPVLVMRDTSERPEAIAAGTVKLVGTSRERIITEATRLLDDPGAYGQMARAHNPYGDGQSAGRIAEVVLNL